MERVRVRARVRVFARAMVGGYFCGVSVGRCYVVFPLVASKRKMRWSGTQELREGLWCLQGGFL